MADIVDLTAIRTAATQPDADCVRRDRFGRPVYLFALEYAFGQSQWSAELWAYSREDAEARVAAMRESLALRGQVYAHVPG